jgi:deoxyribose-phosphate aldolase
VHETKIALKNGATEIDFVTNITEVKAKNFAYIKTEMESIAHVVHEEGREVKVILETAYLTDDEKKKLCELAVEANVDFVKTSTGFAPSGATVADVKLMKSVVGNDAKVKASGGIRDLVKTIEMVDAGASRIGASSAKTIVDQYKDFLDGVYKHPDIPGCEGY